MLNHPTRPLRVHPAQPSAEEGDGVTSFPGYRLTFPLLPGGGVERKDTVR